MVLKEILETCPVICEIDATIRDTRGYRLAEYKIGPLVEEDLEYFWIPNEHTGKLEPRWKCIKKPINYKDAGKDYWGAILQNIPKEFLGRTVTYFDIWDGWRTNNGLNEHRKLMCDLLGTDTCVLIDERKKQMGTSDQIPGQMSLELEG